MRQQVFVGIDVSTTGVKALVIDGRGRVLSSETTSVPLSTPAPLWSEQAPGDWWQAACASLRRVLAASAVEGRDIASVGLTGQMHGLVLLDEAGRVLRPAILWNDQRTGAECQVIRAALGRDRLVALTGNDALPGFTAPKILWVARHEPEVFARARVVLLPKDYVRYRLTGAFATDASDGSGTLLFDLARRGWSSEVTGALRIPEAWLPQVYEGPEVTGTVSGTAALETGLAEGTPVVAGGGDQAAGAIGVGAVEPGVLSVVLGTSGVVFGTTESPEIEPEGRLHAFCHAVPGRWHVMGVMLSAAGSLQWYRDALAPDLTFDDLVEEAAQAPPGADGLLFLPYLTGERTPHADPLARGAFVGLTRRHGRAHLTRAVLEGVAFGLRDCFDLVAPHAATVRSVRASGGGAKSALWCAILASALGVTVERVVGTEGAAFGAALLAGVAAHAWPDVETACRNTIAVTAAIEPDVQWLNRYAELHAAYRELYPALAGTFTRLA